MTALDPHPRPHLVEGPSGEGPDVPDPQQLRRAARRARRAAWRAQFTAALPMRLALGGVASVWAFGAVWSFTEQAAFAFAKGFEHPALLPLSIDGFAVTTAGVAFADSLKGRPAVFARLMAVVGIGGSAAINGVWAAQRSAAGGQGLDPTMVAIGLTVPLVAFVAFEVFLSGLRRQVQRSRGLPPPVTLPPLRLVRLLLAPSTFLDWRNEVLTLTATTPRTVPDTSEDPSELPSLEEAAATLFEVAPNVSRDRIQTILRTNTYWAKKFHGRRPGADQ